MTGQDPLIGSSLHGGTIVLQKLLGVGGMGRVYKGVDTRLNRSVAVKILQPEHLESDEASIYFEREARAASQLWHPNLIQILDFGREDDGTLYIIMEFIPGVSLADIIDDEFPIPPDRVIRIASQILTGLEAAHAAGIIHRDLKPENIMLQDLPGTQDFVKILDFGIAKALNSPDQKAGPLTQQGLLVGTPQFMSPEQALGHELDARSDLYSVGAIVYQMLAQYMPFDGDLVMHVLAKVITERPVEPSRRRPELAIHPDLEAVAMRALRKRPEGRYQNAAEFRVALLDIDPNTTSPSFSSSSTLSVPPLDEPQLVELQAEPIGTPTPSSSGTRARDDRYTVAVLAVEVRSTELIDRFRPVLTQLTETHGGVVVPTRDNLVIISLFGFPTPLEDSAVFGLRAAQGVLAECVQHPRLHLGLGLAYGEAVVPGGRMAECRGDVLQRALDMASRAANSSILAHSSVQRAQAPIHLEPTEAVDAFVPQLNLGDRSAQSVTIGIPLMGRERVLRKLDEYLGALFDGKSVALALTGARGCGKTRILNLMARGAERQNLAVLEVTAERFPSIIPGVLLHRILHAALELVPAEHPIEALETLALDEPVREVLTQLLHLQAPQQQQRVWAELLVFAFSKLLGKLARTAPLLLACDNFEAADELSFRVLLRLADSTMRGPVAIVVSALDGFSNTLRFQRTHNAIALDPIPPELIVTFLTSSFPSVGDETIQRIAAIASRKPQYLEWLMNLAMNHDTRTLTLPPRSIDDYLDPLRSLSPEALRVVGAGACLGFSFPLSTLKGTCPRSWKLREQLHHMGGVGMLTLRENTDGIWLGFYPSVLRTRALTLVDQTLVKEIHQRAAKFFERTRSHNGHPNHDYQWARHLLAAGFAGPALKMFRIAFDKTLSTLGPVAAVPIIDSMLEAAYQAYDRKHEKYLEQVILAARFLLSQGEAEKSLSRLSRLDLDDTPTEGVVEVELLRARAHLLLGERGEASTLLMAAQAKSQDLDPVLSAEVHTEIAEFLFHEDIFNEALDEALVAADLIKDATDVHRLLRPLFWRPLVTAGLAFAELKYHSHAVPVLQDALAEAERRNEPLGQIEALRALSHIHSRSGLIEESLSFINLASNIARDHGELLALAQLKLESALLLIKLHRGKDSRHDLELAIDLAEHLAEHKLAEQAKRHLTVVFSLPG